MTEDTYLGQHYQIIQPRADRWMGWDAETETELTGSYETERQALNATLDSIEQADAEDPQFAYGKPWRELTGDPTLDSIPTEEAMIAEIQRRKREGKE